MATTPHPSSLRRSAARAAIAAIPLLCLAVAGLAPAHAAPAAKALVVGRVETSASVPVEGLEVYFRNVDCAGDPDDDMEDLEVDPYDGGWVWTDADGDFGFAGLVGQCYAIIASDWRGSIDSTIGTRTALRHIIAAPGGLTAAGLSFSMTVDGAVGGGGGPQYLKVEIPGADIGTEVYLIAEYGPGDWWLEDIGVVGIDPADLDDPTIFGPIGGLPNPDETVIFQTVPNLTYALVYVGDSTYYPQLNGGVVVDPATLYPEDESEFAIASTLSPADAVWAMNNPFAVGAVARGRVALSAGGNVGDAFVDAFRFSAAYQGWFAVGTGAVVEPNGTFAVGGLVPSAEHTLNVSHPDYVATWLGGSTDPDAALDGSFQTFVSAASSSSSNVGTITMTARGGSIEGRAVGFPDSAGDEESMVWALNVETNTAHGGYVEGEHYRLSSLSTGVYALQADNTDWWMGVTNYSDEDITEVVEGKTSRVDFEAQGRWVSPGGYTETAVRGRAAVGEVLTIDASDWEKTQWKTNPWSYETTWVQDHKIVGTGTKRAVKPEELGKPLLAATLATADDLRNQWTVASAGGDIALGSAPRLATVPHLSTATPSVGEAITATPGTWEPSPTRIAYQWMAGGIPIPQATNASYTPAPTDIGKELSVMITASSQGREDGKAILPAKDKVKAGDPTSFLKSFKVRLPKTKKVGRAMMAPKPPQGFAATYRWYRGSKAIKGATKSSYTPKFADLGKKVTVRIELSRFGYSAKTVRSSAAKIIEGSFKSMKPVISGKAVVGKKVKAAVAKTQKKVTVSFQWYVDGKKVAGKAGQKTTLKLVKAYRGKKVYAKAEISKKGEKTMTKKTKSLKVK